MKNLYIPIMLLMLLSCSSSNTIHKNDIKIKKFSNKEMRFSYPSTWKLFRISGRISLTPKKIWRKPNREEGNFLLLNKSSIPIDDLKHIDEVLENYGKTLKWSEIKKELNIIKLNSPSKFIYKLESLITNSYDETIFKGVEYFYLLNDSLKYYTFHMREDLFDSYLEDALFIINSVEQKN